MTVVEIALLNSVAFGYHQGSAYSFWVGVSYRKLMGYFLIR
jgi:hypothetical protein